jgi:hypothetical protein
VERLLVDERVKVSDNERVVNLCQQAHFIDSLALLLDGKLGDSNNFDDINQIIDASPNTKHGTK